MPASDLLPRPVAERALRLATRGHSPPAHTFREEGFARGLSSADLFFSRFGGALDYRGKSVLDVGCGTGPAAIRMAQTGAAHVLGVDITPESIEFAQRTLAAEYADLTDRVRFRRIDSLAEIDGKFDLVLSKDSFEHFADPIEIVRQIRPLLDNNGELAVGFGPLWKSPYGGHLNYMTNVPWAHLIFPEDLLMRERRRFVPEGTEWDGAMRFEDTTGGLNRMTYQRLVDVMSEAGMRCVYMATNVHDRRAKQAIGHLSRIPGLKEYFTFNVYSLWRPSS